MKDADVDRLKIETYIKGYEAAALGSSLSVFSADEQYELAKLALQSLSQEAVRDEAQRIYTKADMEAACELALAGYRSKPMLDKMVDRFLAWSLPDSVCADLIATRQGPGRIGTNLLSATEARQMLEHVLKREPNVASRWANSKGDIPADWYEPAPAAPANRKDIFRCDECGKDGMSILQLQAHECKPAPAAFDGAEVVKRLKARIAEEHRPSMIAGAMKALGDTDHEWWHKGNVAARKRMLPLLEEATAILARLGLGLVPVREDLRTIDKELDHGIDD